MDMKKSRVFVVEDEALILESYCSLLKVNGFEVVGTACTGKQALQRFQNLEADIILMDIKLPDANGIDILRQFNQEQIVPCVFITAYFSNELMEEANKVGAFGYILKPVQEQQILAAIHIAQCRAKEFGILRREAADLKSVLEDRKLIERAKGILMKYNHIDEESAMRLLQQKSKENNKKLVIIAKEVIAARSLLNG